MNTMRIVPALALAPLLLLAGCASEPAPPPPPPKPVAKPAPPPPPAPENWMDAPRTPGDWSYRAGTAVYGLPGAAPVFTFACDRLNGRIALRRTGSASGPVPMRVLTETATRLLDAIPAGGTLSVTLPARDPLLDAMAFSKGRFGIEVPGTATLYLPSWTEVSRVIEDCR